MHILDPRRLLARPSIYAAFRNLVSGSDAQRVVMTEYVRAAPRSKVLDIGCGPGVMADALGDVDYTGIEPDARYVDEARRRLGPRGRILHGTAGSVAKRALRPGGRFVSVDCCYTPDQSRLARIVVGLDRGSHIRTPDAFDRLIGGAFRTRASAVRHDLLRVPYTHFIAEATA